MGTLSTPASEAPGPAPPEGEASRPRRTRISFHPDDPPNPDSGEDNAARPEAEHDLRSIVAVAVLAWIVLSPRSGFRRDASQVRRLRGEFRTGLALDCRAKGCLLVILGTDAKAQGAIRPSSRWRGRSRSGAWRRRSSWRATCSRNARGWRGPIAGRAPRPGRPDSEGAGDRAAPVLDRPRVDREDPSSHPESMTEGQVLREAGL